MDYNECIQSEVFMGKRILNCAASDFSAMSAAELLSAIAESEGRTMVSETIGSVPPVLETLTNAELVSAMGADIVLLNMFDVNHPVIQGLPPVEPSETIRELKRLVGRPIGINLEPGTVTDSSSQWALTDGRTASKENARKAFEMGVDLILLTGNPGIGVENAGIIHSLREIRAELGDKIILAAGKMHASGTGEGGSEILSHSDIHDFIEAGADIILMPAPGTVPGITLDWVKERVDEIHRFRKLAMTAIGTSQEGADPETIRSIALMAKQSGTDLHHIGDSGLPGIAVPENIMTYSIAIRGIRHTYRRMAMSINR